jgi:DNA primase
MSSNSNVDQIKERLSITDVLSGYIKIERSGANYKARCPFHNEKTPSFFISPSRNSYYCFGCGVKGDIFSFVQAYEGLDFRGALKQLAEKAGVTLTGAPKENTDEKEKLFAVMEVAATFYQDQLPKHAPSLEYLKNRGVTAETIAAFRLGYAEDGWRTLSTFLLGKGFTEAIIEKAGLIKRTEKGFYDRFRNRIMFPIADTSGRIIAFSGRTLSADEATPKYLNSPDTPLFDKSSALYGIDRAKEFIRKRDYAIVVEGQFDLLLSHQAGVVNTVAASGTALSDAGPQGDRGVANLQMISRFSKNILFAFDGDKAGVNAVYRGSLLALGLGMDVKVARLPEGKDPADVIKENKEAWTTILKGTDSAVAFFAKRIMAMDVAQVERVKLIQKLVLPLIAKIESAVLREHYLTVVEQITSVSVMALRTDVSKIETDVRQVAVVEERGDKSSRRFSIGERLYGIVFWQEAMEQPYVDPKKLEQSIQQVVGEGRAGEIRDSVAEHKEELVFEAEAAYSDPKTLAGECKQLVRELHLRELKHDVEHIATMMRAYEREGKDTDELLKTLQEKNTLLHTIELELKET